MRNADKMRIALAAVGVEVLVPRGTSSGLLEATAEPLENPCEGKAPHSWSLRAGGPK